MEDRDLRDFSNGSADRSLDVEIQQGDTTSVVVSIDSNFAAAGPASRTH